MAKKRFRKKKNRIVDILQSRIARIALAVAIMAISILTIVSLMHVENVGLQTKMTGLLGMWCARVMTALFGTGAILTAAAIGAYGIYMSTNENTSEIKRVGWGTMMTIILFSGAWHIFSVSENAEISTKLSPPQGGGLVGTLVAKTLTGIFGEIGAYIFLASCATVLYFSVFPKSTIRISRETISSLVGIMQRTAGKSNRAFNRLFARSGGTYQSRGDHHAAAGSEQCLSRGKKSSIGMRPENSEDEDRQLERVITNYQAPHSLPPLELLDKTEIVDNAGHDNYLQDQANRLQETLVNFGIAAEVVNIISGPSLIRFEIQPAPGTKISRIVALADDIALALAASPVRMEAPVPGKAVVGIEIPTHESRIIRLSELVSNSQFFQHPSRLAVALGININGNAVYMDIARMPHLLIAGSTGMGKSVCLNVLICCLLLRNHPSEVQFLMIDPKMVELSVYSGIPHLVSPVITQAKRAPAVLRWAVREMERRYELLAQAGAKDMNKYNEHPTDTVLPYLVVIIDELADLMLLAGREIEDSICRLAQMGRAAGIHLVIATQRPSVDVVTGLIKANITSRISFAVSSQVDSRTILDMGGAEKLIGRGDMFFMPVEASKPMRLQGPFLSDQELERIVQFWHSGENNMVEIAEEEDSVAPNGEEDDPLFKEAAVLVMDAGQASVSLLQRRLRIGYARAARLIDQLEQRNIIGPYEGSKPRVVLYTKDRFEKDFSNG